MSHEADDVINDALINLPAVITVADHNTVYGDDSGFLDAEYGAVVAQAAKALRSGGWNRAESVELAYDRFLRHATGGEWSRVGEVVLLKREGVARALCTHRKGSNAS